MSHRAPPSSGAALRRRSLSHPLASRCPHSVGLRRPQSRRAVSQATAAALAPSGGARDGRAGRQGGGGAWTELRRRIAAWEGTQPGVSTHSLSWRGKEGVRSSRWHPPVLSALQGTARREFGARGRRDGAAAALLSAGPSYIWSLDGPGGAAGRLRASSGHRTLPKTVGSQNTKSRALRRVCAHRGQTVRR